MSLWERTKLIVKGFDSIKQATEPGLDAIMAFAGANIAATSLAIDQVQQQNYSAETNGLLYLLTGAALTAANYTLLSNDVAQPVRTGIKATNKFLDRVRPLSWLKTGALAAGLLWSVNQVQPYAESIYQDLNPPTQSLTTTTTTPTTPPSKNNITKATKNRPPIYDQLGYEEIVKDDFTGTKLAAKNSDSGRIQRTLRWERIYSAVEDKYGIPENTLAGMIMEESYGDPVQPNNSGDGGLGVTHIQGTTATAYGMNIYGSSSSARDLKHGEQIKKMLKNCNYSASCVQEFDDRAHLIKVLDTAARIVAEGKEKHGSWDYGVQHYHYPAGIGGKIAWRYMDRVNKWSDKLENEKKLTKAAENFERLNGYEFDNYLDRWSATAVNWGLETYQNQ